MTWLFQSPALPPFRISSSPSGTYSLVVETFPSPIVPSSATVTYSEALTNPGRAAVATGIAAI